MLIPRWLVITTAVALALGALPWPYAYYELLRIGVTIVAVWAAFATFERRSAATEQSTGATCYA